MSKKEKNAKQEMNQENFDDQPKKEPDIVEEEQTEAADTEAEARASETEQPDHASKEALEAAAKKAEAAIKDKMLRLQADFENYKRRSQKEKADVYSHAMESLMSKLLPVIDNFERAEATETDNLESYREGIAMIFKELWNVLSTEGLQEIEAEGTAFDPNFHHGVAVGEDPEKDDQTVLEVFQKGYRFKDKVIRPAMVKVNQK